MMNFVERSGSGVALSNIRVAIWTAILSASVVLAQIAHGAEARCGQPVTEGIRPLTSDCLYILRAAVGAIECDPLCVCKPAGRSTTTVLDALICLKRALLLPVLLDCGCPGSTLEVRDYSETPSFRFYIESSFGFCVGLNSPLSAQITNVGNGQLEFEATLLVEGDRANGDDCRDDIKTIADHEVDCAVEKHIGPRALTTDEIDLVARRLSRVQVDLAQDPRCAEGTTVDFCSQEKAVFDGAGIDDNLCSAPRLLFDQVRRFLDLLTVLAENTA